MLTAPQIKCFFSHVANIRHRPESVFFQIRIAAFFLLHLSNNSPEELDFSP